MRHGRPAAVLLTAVSASLVLAACTPGATPSPTPTGVAVEDVAELADLTLDALPDPDWVTATDRGVWIAGVGDGIVRFADDGRPSGSVATGPISLAMEVGFGSLWAAENVDGSSALVRVDLEDPAVVTRVDIGDKLADESSLAVTDDRVWGLTEAMPRRLLGVDPETERVVDTIEVADDAAAVRAGFGSLWLTRSDTSSLDRIDPATGEVQATVTVGVLPQFLAIGPDAVWVMNQIGPSVSRVDPETDAVVAEIPLEGEEIQGGDIVASAEAVWVRTTAELAVLIDPGSNAVARRIGPSQGSGSIAVAVDGSVWISAHDVSTVWRLPA